MSSSSDVYLICSIDTYQCLDFTLHKTLSLHSSKYNVRFVYITRRTDVCGVGFMNVCFADITLVAQRFQVAFNHRADVVST